MTNPSRRAEQVATGTPDVLAERVEQLRHLFPEAFSEGKVDPEKLCACLGEFADERPERYSFTWAGKRDAIRLLQTPSQATLVPAPEESVSFEQTNNIFIEGENLEVLKLLYKSYFGRVKMIYIDPPYNTGNDFIYPDHYADPLDTYLKLTGQKDGDGNLLTSNPETSGRYHSNWLSMMYPRLFLARQLLLESGVILISIDDGEVANLKLLMNEVFGEENFLSHIVWQKRYVSNVTAQFLSDMHDHILVYARQKELTKASRLPRTEEQLKDYTNPDDDPRGPWRAQDLSASKPYSAGLFTIMTPQGLECNPPPGRYWRCNQAQYKEWLTENRIWFGKGGRGRPMLKAFLSEAQEGLTPNTWWSHEFAGHNKEATLEVKELFDGGSPFDTAKPVRLMVRMLELFTDPDSLVLDFFAGSCTMAQAVLEFNRRQGSNCHYMMVQLPEHVSERSVAYQAGLKSIAEVGKERIRRVAGKLRQARQGQFDMSGRDEPEDLGFKVFKLASSSFRSWTGVTSGKPEAYAEQIALFTDPLIEGWTTENVVYEVALKEGYGLNCQIGRVEAVGENAVYRVADPDKDQSFYISLDNAIRLEGIRPLGLTADDLFICRDCALDDETAANLALQCRLKTI